MQHLFKTSISKKSLWSLKNYSSSDILFKKNCNLMIIWILKKRFELKPPGSPAWFFKVTPCSAIKNIFRGNISKTLISCSAYFCMTYFFEEFCTKTNFRSQDKLKIDMDIVLQMDQFIPIIYLLAAIQIAPTTINLQKNEKWCRPKVIRIN